MAKKPPAPDLSVLSLEENDTLILSLFARLDALESKVNKTSQNSSKPPGGQAGYKGTTLKRVAEPTGTVHHLLPQQCMRCHSALPLEQAEVAARRQIIDMPATVFDVIEHRMLAVTCR
ncbi:hypothetical protein ACQ4WP_08785 [Janthinobacterium sp. GB4P2]|uniref:hypothetical protein n=1 Tax=Janthinobacterium sp. GB4P2 TaxID=3424189 RepID=UPI003F213997